MTTCSVEGCEKLARVRGWCQMHYSRWHRHGDPGSAEASKVYESREVCSIEGCGKPHVARTFCATHYRRWSLYGDPGTADLINRPHDPAEAERECRICGEVKLIDQFYRDRNVRAWQCKTCYGQKQRNAVLMRKYGITQADYDAMAAAQDNRCAICREKRPLVVDHCHRSGKVRELLCNRCNRLLGDVDDDPELLRAALRFLSKHHQEKL